MSAHEYSPGDYDAMLADRVRGPAYLAAIARTVRPGDVVVEVGTGVGYFAVAAARAGARRVYAIERDPSVTLAAAIVRENGCDDRVTCIQGDAMRTTLPERGSVLLSDLRGLVPLYRSGVATIIDARDRLLVAGARMIPVRDTMYAAPCEAPAEWRETELALGAMPFGIARASAARTARAAMRRDRVEASGLLADGAVVATLEYATIASPDVDATLEWTIARDGAAEGIVLWFDAVLADGVGFSTAPGAPRTVYGNGFLPFQRTRSVRAGDRLTCRLRAKLVEGTYVFAWDTALRPASGAPADDMRQSTLAGLVMAPADLARRRAPHTPTPESFADVRAALDLVDGKRTLADIAAEARRRRPDRFASDAAALSWAAGALAALEDLSRASN
ncbi:MAG TPA: 50S ribosomal protein L11 methyltransferase [Gemmatimonadaceae bacterium]|nr:50S ribosomal protein L11 methyltransferase [Gemmatimonadaceae bacterium]